jgi:hypothetical protein
MMQKGVVKLQYTYIDKKIASKGDEQMSRIENTFSQIGHADLMKEE